MAFTTYTSKVSLPITYQWKCSKCGSVNRASTTVETKGQSMSSGRKVNPVSQNIASATAQSQMNDILPALMGRGTHYRQYRELGLNEPCNNCRHKEPWMANDLNWLREFIFRVGVIVLLVDALLLCLNTLFLFSGKSRGSEQHRIDLIGEFVLIGVAALLVGGYYLYIHISSGYEVKKDVEISKMPKASLPILILNGKPVIDLSILEKTDAEKDRRRGLDQTRISAQSTSVTYPDAPKKNTVQNVSNSISNSHYSAADEIEKFKGLLDKGIITQEEFEAKKKQLLGL